MLGRLLYSWKDIVGPDVVENILPRRCLRGNLVLWCSNSQWLHTLNYLKEEIVGKICKRFPEMKFKVVRGEIGRISPRWLPIPSESWPSWEEEPAPGIPDIGNESLEDSIIRCRKKLAARMKGLRLRGFLPCPKCGSVLVPKGCSSCAVCRWKTREGILARIRSFLNEAPWASLEDIRSEIPSARPLEVEAMKSDLYCESASRISLLGERLRETFDPDDRTGLRFEIIRAISLKTGLSPASIDIENHPDDLFPDPNWKKFLETPEDSPEC